MLSSQCPLASLGSVRYGLWPVAVVVRWGLCLASEPQLHSSVWFVLEFVW